MVFWFSIQDFRYRRRLGSSLGPCWNQNFHTYITKSHFFWQHGSREKFLWNKLKGILTWKFFFFFFDCSRFFFCCFDTMGQPPGNQSGERQNFCLDNGFIGAANTSSLEDIPLDCLWLPFLNDIPILKSLTVIRSKLWRQTLAMWITRKQTSNGRLRNSLIITNCTVSPVACTSESPDLLLLTFPRWWTPLSAGKTNQPTALSPTYTKTIHQESSTCWVSVSRSSKTTYCPRRNAMKPRIADFIRWMAPIRPPRTQFFSSMNIQMDKDICRRYDGRSQRKDSLPQRKQFFGPQSWTNFYDCLLHWIWSVVGTVCQEGLHDQGDIHGVVSLKNHHTVGVAPGTISSHFEYWSHLISPHLCSFPMLCIIWTTQLSCDEMPKIHHGLEISSSSNLLELFFVCPPMFFA